MSQKELLIFLDTLQFIFTKLELIDSSHLSARACLTRVVAIASAAQLGQTYFVRPLLFSKGEREAPCCSVTAYVPQTWRNHRQHGRHYNRCLAQHRRL
jgi:hypothetical protein